MWAPERHAHHPVTSPVGPCFLISNVVATITALGMLLCPWAIPRGPSPASLPFTPPAWNDRHVSMEAVSGAPQVCITRSLEPANLDGVPDTQVGSRRDVPGWPF